MSKALVKHYGRVVEGERKYYTEELLRRNLESLEGQEFEETIKLRHKKVSRDTHGYYRGGILPTCHESEWFSSVDTQDTIHEFFADLFLSFHKEVKVGGQVLTIKKVLSTSEINQKEMNEFIDKVLAWCAHHDIVVLDPEQYNYQRYRTVDRDAKASD